VSVSASSSDLEAAESTVEGGFGLAVVCFFFSFVGLFGGYTMFMPGVNALHVLLHGVGGILTALFILGTWHVAAIWWIVIPFSLFPALVEALVIIGVHALGVTVY
jgi:hypothetical protein